MLVCISYQDTVNGSFGRGNLRGNFFLLYYYKVRVRRVATRVAPMKALQEVRGKNPSVTASPCQPPLGKEAMGTGVRIATTSLRTGLAMTPFTRGAVQHRRADRVVRPYGAIRGVVRDRVGRPQGSPLGKRYKGCSARQAGDRKGRPYGGFTKGAVGRGMPYTHTYAYTLYTPAKASQSLPPAGGKKIQIIFHRDMCVGKNTSQAASVEFCRLRQNYARSRLQTPLAENSAGIFCQ